jgi:hypothetical protein
MIYHRDTEDTEVSARQGDKETGGQGDLCAARVMLRSETVAMPWLFAVLFVLCGECFCARSVLSAESLEGVTVDGELFAGELVGLTDEQAKFREKASDKSTDKVRTLPLSEFVRWGFPATPQPRIWVLIDDGSRIVAASEWAGGAAVRLDGEEFLIRSDTFAEVRLSRSYVRGIIFDTRAAQGEREQLSRQVRETVDDQGVFWLTNGDRLAGSLKQLMGGKLTIETEAGTARFPLSRIRAWASDAWTGVPPLSNFGRFVIGTRDGSLIRAAQIINTDKTLDLDLLVPEFGTRLSGLAVNDIVSIQSVGGRFAYLSDMKAEGYRHVPYLDVEWPYERDRNVTGGPLVVGGRRFLKGIGMHSASRLTYRLDKKYQRFDAAVAVDDAAEGRGSVTFGVYLLRDGKLTEAYKSEIVRGGEAPRAVSVDVSGADAVTLVVDYADRGDEMDRGEWLDARLVQE